MLLVFEAHSESKRELAYSSRRKEEEVSTIEVSEATRVSPITGGFGMEFGEEGPEVRGLSQWLNEAYSFLEVGVYEVSRKCVFGIESSVHEESTIRLGHMIHEVLALYDGKFDCVFVTSSWS